MSKLRFHELQEWLCWIRDAGTPWTGRRRAFLCQVPGETLFLNAETMSMGADKPLSHSICSYDSENRDNIAVFSYRIPEKLELSGYMKLRIWVAAESADDFELFIYQHKADANGNAMLPVVYGAEMAGFEGQKFLGTSGWLKASLRKTVGYRTDGMWVNREFRESEFPTPGEPVLMEITLSPMAMNYYPGEHLKVSYACGLAWGFLAGVLTPVLKAAGLIPFALVEYLLSMFLILFVHKGLLGETPFGKLTCVFLGFAESIACATAMFPADGTMQEYLPPMSMNFVDLFIIFVIGCALCLLIDLIAGFLIGRFTKRNAPKPEAELPNS